MNFTECFLKHTCVRNILNSCNSWDIGGLDWVFNLTFWMMQAYAEQVQAYAKLPMVLNLAIKAFIAFLYMTCAFQIFFHKCYAI